MMRKAKEETKDSIGIMARIKPAINRDFIDLAQLEGRSKASLLRHVVTRYVQENRFRLQEAGHGQQQNTAG